MYKLKDIISSGGTNPKINKAIDRYELSKDEKKDILNTIKNTAQGGGDAPGGSGESAWRYFNISSNPSLAQSLSEVAMLIVGTSAEMGGRVIIVACGMFLISDLVVLGVAADASQRYENPRMSSDVGTVLDSLKQMLPDGFDEITKEEFYNLGA
mgnify:CR=1 FL=1